MDLTFFMTCFVWYTHTACVFLLRYPGGLLDFLVIITKHVDYYYVTSFHPAIDILNAIALPCDSGILLF